MSRATGPGVIGVANSAEHRRRYNLAHNLRAMRHGFGAARTCTRQAALLTSLAAQPSLLMRRHRRRKHPARAVWRAIWRKYFRHLDWTLSRPEDFARWPLIDHGDEDRIGLSAPQIAPISGQIAAHTGASRPTGPHEWRKSLIPEYPPRRIIEAKDAPYRSRSKRSYTVWTRNRHSCRLGCASLRGWLQSILQSQKASSRWSRHGFAD